MSLKKAFGANEKLREAFLSSCVSRLLSLGNEARLAPTKTLIKRNAIIFVVSQRQGVAGNAPTRNPKYTLSS